MSIASPPTNEIDQIRADRGADYGPFWDNAPHAVAIMRAMTHGVRPRFVSGHKAFDECLEYTLWMIATKVSRLAESPQHRDSILDLGGYAKCLLDTWDHYFGEPQGTPEPGSNVSPKEAGKKRLGPLTGPPTTLDPASAEQLCPKVEADEAACKASMEGDPTELGSIDQGTWVTWFCFKASRPRVGVIFKRGDDGRYHIKEYEDGGLNATYGLMRSALTPLGSSAGKVVGFAGEKDGAPYMAEMMPGVSDGSVEAWSIGQTSPTPYLAKIMDEIDENSPVEEAVIMPAEAQGKTETGSVHLRELEAEITRLRSFESGWRQLEEALGRCDDERARLDLTHHVPALQQLVDDLTEQRAAAVDRVTELTAELDHLQRSLDDAHDRLRAVVGQATGEYPPEEDEFSLGDEVDAVADLLGRYKRAAQAAGLKAMEVESIASEPEVRRRRLTKDAQVGDRVRHVYGGREGVVMDVIEEGVVVQVDGAAITTLFSTPESSLEFIGATQGTDAGSIAKDGGATS